MLYIARFCAPKRKLETLRGVIVMRSEQDRIGLLDDFGFAWSCVVRHVEPFHAKETAGFSCPHIFHGATSLEISLSFASGEVSELRSLYVLTTNDGGTYGAGRPRLKWMSWSRTYVAL